MKGKFSDGLQDLVRPVKEEVAVKEEQAKVEPVKMIEKKNEVKKEAIEDVKENVEKEAVDTQSALEQDDIKAAVKTKKGKEPGAVIRFSISVDEELAEILEIGASVYCNGKKNKYINKLIREDGERNKAMYDWYKGMKGEN